MVNLILLKFLIEVKLEDRKEKTRWRKLFGRRYGGIREI